MTKKQFNTDKHKQVLTQVLLDIIKSLGSKLAFKGGTAAMLFYDLPRMSLDLGFDLLENLNDENIDSLKEILGKYGIVKEYRDKKYTIFFLLDYEKYFPNIKIEINKRVWKNNVYDLVRFLGIEIKIADKTSSFSNKLVALSERRTIAARDLFDVHYFFKLGYSINENLIKERTNKSLNEYLSYLKKFIKKHYTIKNVLSGLGEVLDEDQKKWAKNHLLDETIKEIEKLIKIRQKA